MIVSHRASSRSDFGGVLLVDLRKTQHGGSAVRVLSTPTTEVSFGALHARVRLDDLGLEITMDSEPGDWKDEAWARARALEALSAALTVENLLRLLKVAGEAGYELGGRHTRHEIRTALGIT